MSCHAVVEASICAVSTTTSKDNARSLRTMENALEVSVNCEIKNGVHHVSR